MNRVKERREIMGFRLCDVSRLSGLSIAHLWNMEHGVRASKEAHEKVARVLRTSVKELFPSE